MGLITKITLQKNIVLTEAYINIVSVEYKKELRTIIAKINIYANESSKNQDPVGNIVETQNIEIKDTLHIQELLDLCYTGVRLSLSTNCKDA